MNHTQGKCYAVEYAGFWTIQDVPDYSEKADLLDAECVGEERAEANAKRVSHCWNTHDLLIDALKKIEVIADNGEQNERLNSIVGIVNETLKTTNPKI